MMTRRYSKQPEHAIKLPRSSKSLGAFAVARFGLGKQDETEC